MDGGWGWMVLIGAFFSYFIVDGWAYSFGMMFPEAVDQFDESKGNTALVPTLMYALPMIISPFVCALTAVCGCRKVAICGSVITSLSFIVASLSNTFSLFCVSIGLFSSIGLAMIYVPSFVAVTCNFEKLRGLATGLAVTGSGLGSFAFPPLIIFLMGTYAWRGMLLIMAGICLNLLVFGALYRPVIENRDTKVLLVDIVEEIENTEMHSCDLKPSETELQVMADENIVNNTTSGVTEVNFMCDSIVDFQEQEKSETTNRQSPHLDGVNSVPFVNTCQGSVKVFWHELHNLVCAMFDKSVLTNGPFLWFCGVNFFIFLWVSVPYVYLVDKALILGIKHQPLSLLSTIGIARTVGQILVGVVGDRPQVSSNFLYGFSIAVTGLATALVPVCMNYTSLTVYAATFGLFVSVTYVLPMMCLVEIITLEKATNAFGLLQFVQGMGTLIGTPIVGRLSVFFANAV